MQAIELPRKSTNNFLAFYLQSLMEVTDFPKINKKRKKLSTLIFIFNYACLYSLNWLKY
jgi:hypothetical protein